MEWKFKEDVEPKGSSDGFWYDINNGYIKPGQLLEGDDQIKAVNAAIETLESFERAMETAGLINEF